MLFRSVTVSSKSYRHLLAISIDGKKLVREITSWVFTLKLSRSRCAFIFCLFESSRLAWSCVGSKTNSSRLLQLFALSWTAIASLLAEKKEGDLRKYKNVPCQCVFVTPPLFLSPFHIVLSRTAKYEFICQFSIVLKRGQLLT